MDNKYIGLLGLCIAGLFSILYGLNNLFVSHCFYSEINFLAFVFIGFGLFVFGIVTIELYKEGE